MQTLRRKTPGEQQARNGVAALEAAVVTPMLLVLVLGTIEMGTALRASTIMQSAVREAGRLVNMDWNQVIGENDDPNSKVTRDLRNFVQASGLPGDVLIDLRAGTVRLLRDQPKAAQPSPREPEPWED